MYKLRAFINGEMHDIKDYTLDKNELTMTSTYKDAKYKLEDAEYVIVKTADLKALLEEVYMDGAKNGLPKEEVKIPTAETKTIQSNTKYNKTKK